MPFGRTAPARARSPAPRGAIPARPQTPLPHSLAAQSSSHHAAPRRERSPPPVPSGSGHRAQRPPDSKTCAAQRPATARAARRSSARSSSDRWQTPATRQSPEPPTIHPTDHARNARSPAPKPPPQSRPRQDSSGTTRSPPPPVPQKLATAAGPSPCAVSRQKKTWQRPARSSARKRSRNPPPTTRSPSGP